MAKGITYFVVDSTGHVARRHSERHVEPIYGWAVAMRDPNGLWSTSYHSTRELAAEKAAWHKRHYPAGEREILPTTAVAGRAAEYPGKVEVARRLAVGAARAQARA